MNCSLVLWMRCHLEILELIEICFVIFVGTFIKIQNFKRVLKYQLFQNQNTQNVMAVKVKVKVAVNVKVKEIKEMKEEVVLPKCPSIPKPYPHVPLPYPQEKNLVGKLVVEPVVAAAIELLVNFGNIRSNDIQEKNTGFTNNNIFYVVSKKY